MNDSHIIIKINNSNDDQTSFFKRSNRTKTTPLKIILSPNKFDTLPTISRRNPHNLFESEPRKLNNSTQNRNFHTTENPKNHPRRKTSGSPTVPKSTEEPRGLPSGREVGGKPPLEWVTDFTPASGPSRVVKMSRRKCCDSNVWWNFVSWIIIVGIIEGGVRQCCRMLMRFFFVVPFWW